MLFYALYKSVCYYLRNMTLWSCCGVYALCLLLYVIYDRTLEEQLSINKIILRSVYLTFLFCITIVGRSTTSNEYTLETLFSTYISTIKGVKYSAYNILFNIILFVPSCMLLKNDGVKKTVAKIVVLSTLIEVCQLLSSRGVFEVCDIIDNTIGGILGLVMKNSYLRLKIKGISLKKGLGKCIRFFERSKNVHVKRYNLDDK